MITNITVSQVFIVYNIRSYSFVGTIFRGFPKEINIYINVVH